MNIDYTVTVFLWTDVKKDDNLLVFVIEQPLDDNAKNIPVTNATIYRSLVLTNC